MKILLKKLQAQLEGELHYDNLHKTIYATDASVYRKIPLAAALPKTVQDIKVLCEFALQNDITLIPRTAGTSLAGQCVGDGIVVDVSKHFTNIISFDKEKKQVVVQPGVIRDELNLFLKPHGLFFGPNTSTANRCMIGGMVGNNSSGTTSIQYGVTRDKTLRLKTILSDGSEATFEDLDEVLFREKLTLNTLEGKIYNTIYTSLIDKESRAEIATHFPKPEIHRRNTGYALDYLAQMNPFHVSGKDFNMCSLLAGSEGTLAFTTEITLQLDELPPAYNVLVAAHFEDLTSCLKAVVPAMRHNLFTCEMMDKVILDCTKNNREAAKNRFFLQGDPEAVLMLEVSANTLSEAELLADTLIEDLKKNNFGYHHPKVYGKDITKVHQLRKAGLGLLGNMIGDKKAVACIEDTAVALDDLPNYIEEFTQIMDKYQQDAVYYAHAGAGELHLRPILNLKKKEDVVLFRKITTETAELVKKYKGSFSGEHGDGIVRAEFIPLMIGDKNYQLLRRIKKAFDPNNVFNQGKITEAFSMDENLRYEIDRIEPKIETIQDFSDNQGILKLAEKCNGSGDCRKPIEAGGTLCPSYRATKDEKETTRARANTLREVLTHNKEANKFNSAELKEVLDLCLSCKACATECPSNVDIATMKAEFLYQYQETNGYSFRSKMFANNVKYNKLGSKLPAITNLLTNSIIAKKILGVAAKRSVPKLAIQTFEKWLKKNNTNSNQSLKTDKSVYLFKDEFTNYYDTEIGKDAFLLLEKLGYEIKSISHNESGRSHISKGFLKEAKEICNSNIAVFKDLISKSNHEDKNIIIAVAEMESDPTKREEEIQARSPTDKVLEKDIFPQLRRSQMHLSDNEIFDYLNNNKSNDHLEQCFHCQERLKNRSDFQSRLDQSYQHSELKMQWNLLEEEFDRNFYHLRQYNMESKIKKLQLGLLSVAACLCLVLLIPLFTSTEVILELKVATVVNETPALALFLNEAFITT